MAERSAFSVGQRLFRVQPNRRPPATKDWVVITAIGRKWVTVATEGHYRLESRFSIETMRGEGYEPPSFWFSEERYDEHCRLRAAWETCAKAIVPYRMPPDFTMEKAQAIASALGIKITDHEARHD